MESGTENRRISQKSHFFCFRQLFLPSTVRPLLSPPEISLAIRQEIGFVPQPNSALISPQVLSGRPVTPKNNWLCFSALFRSPQPDPSSPTHVAESSGCMLPVWPMRHWRTSRPRGRFRHEAHLDGRSPQPGNWVCFASITVNRTMLSAPGQTTKAQLRFGFVSSLFWYTRHPLHLDRPFRLPDRSSPDDTSTQPAEVGLACTFLRWVLTLTDSRIDNERTGSDQDERSVSSEYAPSSLCLADKFSFWLSYPGLVRQRGDRDRQP